MIAVATMILSLIDTDVEITILNTGPVVSQLMTWRHLQVSSDPPHLNGDSPQGSVFVFNRPD